LRSNRRSGRAARIIAQRLPSQQADDPAFGVQRIISPFVCGAPF
jgi:hypothetical protein